MYTFGAPRPGNRAFKEEYDQLIPDTWNVINDAVSILHPGLGHNWLCIISLAFAGCRPVQLSLQLPCPRAHCHSTPVLNGGVMLQDAVPRVGKFFILFSRPGKRVIVDYRGDVVVRPSPYEIFIRSGRL